MNKQQVLEGMGRSKSAYVVYGYDLTVPVERDEAIKLIKEMDEDFFGDVDWYECDSMGNI